MTDETLDLVELETIVKTMLDHMDRSEFDRFVLTMRSHTKTMAGLMEIAADLQQADPRS